MSLAVEEQFYVFFPLLLMLLWRFGRRFLTWVLVAVLLISLSWSEWSSRVPENGDFYFLTTRAWELLIGVLVAQLLMYRPTIGARIGQNIGSALGLALILFSVFFFSERTPFPSVYALVPTLGTALIVVFANQNTWVGRLLSLRGLIAIGLLSYSAYLWHQPLFAFSRLISFGEPTRNVYAFLILLSFALAWFTWAFVEQPCRNKVRFSRNIIVAGALAISIILVLLSTVTKHYSGFPSRIKFDFDSVFARFPPTKKYECSSDSLADKSCRIGNYASPSVAIIGDSHAMVQAHSLDPQLKKIGVAAVLLAKPGCIPVRHLTKGKGDCSQYNEMVFRYISENKEIRTVILLARWPLYIEGMRFNNGEGGQERGKGVYSAPTDLSSGSPSDTQRKVIIERHTTKQIEQYLSMGKKVILVYPVPEVGWDPKRVAFISTQFLGKRFKDIELSTDYQRFKKRTAGAYNALDDVRDTPNLFRIRPADIFCDSFIANRCAVAYDGVQFYRDDDHLRIDGTKMVDREIVDILRTLHPAAD